MIKQNSKPDAPEASAERLANTERELNEVLYAVSHDMRAPLRAISGFADALREDLSGRLDPTSEDYLKRICASSRTLERMLEGVVILSRINRASCVIVHDNVSATCVDILRGLQEAHPRRIVSTRVTPGMELDTDRRLLRQALEALIGNAWKFTAGVGAARIAVDIRREAGGGLAIVVEDNGVGFDTHAAADRLFGLFQRFHGSDDQGGSGVGLASALRIAHKLGGSLTCRSSPGHGATFTLSIPHGFSRHDYDSPRPYPAD